MAGADGEWFRNMGVWPALGAGVFPGNRSHEPAGGAWAPSDPRGHSSAGAVGRGFSPAGAEAGGRTGRDARCPFRPARLPPSGQPWLRLRTGSERRLLPGPGRERPGTVVSRKPRPGNRRVAGRGCECPRGVGFHPRLGNRHRGWRRGHRTHPSRAVRRAARHAAFQFRQRPAHGHPGGFRQHRSPRDFVRGADRRHRQQCARHERTRAGSAARQLGGVPQQRPAGGGRCLGHDVCDLARADQRAKPQLGQCDGPSARPHRLGTHRH